MTQVELEAYDAMTKDRDTWKLCFEAMENARNGSARESARYLSERNKARKQRDEMINDVRCLVIECEDLPLCLGVDARLWIMGEAKSILEQYPEMKP